MKMTHFSLCHTLFPVMGVRLIPSCAESQCRCTAVLLSM